MYIYGRAKVIESLYFCEDFIFIFIFEFANTCSQKLELKDSVDCKYRVKIGFEWHELELVCMDQLFYETGLML